MNKLERIDSRHTAPTPPNGALAVFGGPSGQGSNTIAALAHDARNLITALGLYCDLLDEPGVFTPPFAHYRNELRLVAAAGRRLVSELSAQSERNSAASLSLLPTPIASLPFETQCPMPGHRPATLAQAAHRRAEFPRFDDEFAATPITNLAAELLANRNLLAAIAGPGIAVTVDVEGGARGIQLSAEDLTRILVNLVRNSAEAMSSSGRIRISLTEIGSSEDSRAGKSSAAEVPTRLRLAIEDNGPGISPELIDKVFDRGFTTHDPAFGSENKASLHRGLGLAITRSIIESACGRIQVSNREGGGARFLMELTAL